MENLAPAGNREALERAVSAGADAVYLGYAAFSARAGAGNFDEDALAEAVRFAHLHRVRVHVTVNTLVKDAELDGVLTVLRLMNRLRVDAVLVQDLGVLSLARQCFPDLTVHASTQMAIHNATGAAWCHAQGMKRVVLARECSAAEIALCAQKPIEIEVFGHGAQCVSVSGECLFSSMLGERSGNRGRCAQPCRLPYTYRGKTAAWLSPRDVCLRDDLPTLAKAGVTSLKLEGRLKRPEYVATVARSYRQGIDSLTNGRFAPTDEAEKRGLLQIFQRGGFMRGYAMGAEDSGVICEERVNHGGVTIGRVEVVMNGFARVRLTLPLHDSDGLQFRSTSGDGEMIYAGRDMAAGDIAVVRLRPDLRVQPGDAVVRLTDAQQLAEAQALTVPPIPVTMTLTALPGKPLALTVTDGISTVEAVGDVVSPAEKRAMTVEDACRSLGKMGDTPFTPEDIEVVTDNAFVPVSALNSLRRQGLETLTEARCDAFAPPVGEERSLPEEHLSAGTVPTTVIFRTAAQAEAIQDRQVRMVWYPEDFRTEALEAALLTLTEGVWLQLPTVCEEKTLEELHAFVTRHQARLGGVVLGSVGQLGLAWPCAMGAGSGIPVMNRRAAELLFAAGCCFVAASAELTRRETAALMAGGAPILCPAYGRVQLMLLHHCPARTYLGLKSGHSGCRLCDMQDKNALAGTSLRDRKGVAFPLLRQRLPEGCLVRLMNALPTDNLCPAGQANLPVLIELTDEQAAEAVQVMDAAEAHRPLPWKTTAGHWLRAVE